MNDIAAEPRAEDTHVVQLAAVTSAAVAVADPALDDQTQPADMQPNVAPDTSTAAPQSEDQQTAPSVPAEEAASQAVAAQIPQLPHSEALSIPPEALPTPLEALSAQLEAVLFASGEALSISRLHSVTGIEEKKVRELLSELREQLSSPQRGIELVEVAGQYQLRTKDQFSQVIRNLKGSAPRRLSSAALETLSIIAYRQPIVRSDIERIRGVDVLPTLKTLLERGLVQIIGHQQTVGQPALYGTTEEFLKLFGLRNLGELPTLRDLRELSAEPGEGAEPGQSAAAG